MRIAFQIDQLWFDAPGGIGTYVRELIPALTAEDPALALTLFRCRFADPDRGPSSIAGLSTLEVPGPIRTLYPQWAMLGRPKLPRPSTRSTWCTPRTRPGLRRCAPVRSWW